MLQTLRHQLFLAQREAAPDAAFGWQPMDLATGFPHGRIGVVAFPEQPSWSHDRQSHALHLVPGAASQ